MVSLFGLRTVFNEMDKHLSNNILTNNGRVDLAIIGENLICVNC